MFPAGEVFGMKKPAPRRIPKRVIHFNPRPWGISIFYVFLYFNVNQLLQKIIEPCSLFFPS